MNWDDLKYYLAVTRARGLSEAARKLHVSPSTVSRRIDALEQALGVKLFSRRQDGYDLTEAGENLLSTAEQTEANLLWLQRGAAINETDAVGVVRLVMPELLGQYLIIPELSKLQKDHPEIQLEVITDVRSSPLTKREADLVLRLNRPTQGHYTVQRIGRLNQALYASEEYLATMGTPQTSSDLVKHHLIGWDTELSCLPLARYIEERPEITKLYLRTGNFQAQLIAAQANLGIAALPKFAAQKFGLQAVLAHEPPLQSEIWMIKQEASRHLKRVSIVAEAVTKIIKQAQPHLI